MLKLKKITLKFIMNVKSFSCCFYQNPKWSLTISIKSPLVSLSCTNECLNILYLSQNSRRTEMLVATMWAIVYIKSYRYLLCITLMKFIIFNYFSGVSIWTTEHWTEGSWQERTQFQRGADEGRTRSDQPPVWK